MNPRNYPEILDLDHIPSALEALRDAVSQDVQDLVDTAPSQIESGTGVLSIDSDEVTTNKKIIIVGNARDGSSDADDGVVIEIEHDEAGNRQILVHPTDDDAGFRVAFIVGTVRMDAVGSSHLPLYLGNEQGVIFNGILVLSGNGSPEGVVAAPVGSMYLRKDGSAGSTLYIKESGTGNVGWVAK